MEGDSRESLIHTYLKNPFVHYNDSDIETPPLQDG